MNAKCIFAAAVAAAAVPAFAGGTIRLVGCELDLDKSDVLHRFAKFNPADWTLTRNPSKWTVTEDAIIGGGPDDPHTGQIFYKTPVSGDVVMEFDAMLVPPSYHDFVWVWNADFEKTGKMEWKTGYLASLGGWWDNLSGIERLPKFEPQSISKGFEIEPGRTYRIVSGTSKGRNFIAVDGKLVTWFVDPDAKIPDRPGYFGFGVYRSMARYSNLTVYRPCVRHIPHGYEPATKRAARLAAAGNLLNGSFADDGFGGVLDWGFGRTSGRTRMERLSERAPDGGVAIRIHGGPGEFVFRHLALKLVEGEQYRLSAWVRTKNLASVKRKELEVHNNGWSRSVCAPLPDDTGGQWKKVEWTGKMIHSDGNIWQCLLYFSSFETDSVVDVASPSLVPISDKARAESSAVVPFSKPFRPRIVPIDPLLADFDADRGRMSFLYAGSPSCGFAACDLEGRIDGGAPVRSAVGADGRASLEFGATAPGTHRLSVRAVERGTGAELASSEYTVTAKRHEKWPAQGRRLNNFVTELFTRELRDGRYDFINPRDGWVFVGFDRPYRGVEARIDDGEEPVVVYREFEPSETMRRLPAGRHSVKVSGAAGVRGGRISVRLVKPILHGGGRLMRTTPTDVAGYSWGPEFYRRFGYHFFNETTSEHVAARALRNAPVDPKLDRLILDVEARGMRVSDTFHIAPGESVRNDLEALSELMGSYGRVTKGGPFLIDENSVGATRLMHYNWGEACWRTWGPRQTVGVFFNDATGSSFMDPIGHTLELSATLNSGDGTAMLVPEVYLRIKEDEQDAYSQEDYFLAWMESARALVPSAPSHINFYLGGWLTQGQWTPYYCPEGDAKVLYDHFIHRLATDPAFADLGGAGFSNPSCDESLFRWAMKLLHYYCVEGGTEQLAAKHGFRYAGHVRNGEFVDGFDGWQVSAAEPGSLKADKLKSFGKWGMKRCFPNAGRPAKCAWGDSFAVFERSGKGPNVLRQRISGLEPGHAYELMFCTADRDNVVKKTHPPKDFVFNARIDGAEELKSLAYRHGSVMLAMDRKAGRVVPIIVTHRHVFRAKGPEAEIVFSDWKDASTPGGAVGEARFLNFVGVRSFYEGEPGDIAVLEEMLR